jgi:hypothetical protein
VASGGREGGVGIVVFRVNFDPQSAEPFTNCRLYLLAVSANLNRLAVIPRILEILACVEVKAPFVNPLEFKDSTELGL